MICVVIPYYQREAGILRRALASVAAQQACPLPLHVIVVDDGSPAAAAAEIDAAGPMPCTVQTIVQANAGPGAARNTGIAQRPAGTEYLAFLDSDDEWSPDHLARALSALRAGFDFYFADFMQPGAGVSAFARAGRIPLAQHLAIDSAAADLYAFQGNLQDQVIVGNVIGTPTVVYDVRRLATQRFLVEFRNAGEDYLFWLDVAAASARVAFSSRCEVVCGRGVNVYAGAGWGSDAHMQRIHDEMRFRKLTRRRYVLTRSQQAHIAAAVGELRASFARDLLHRLAHRKTLSPRLLLAQLRLDPMSYLMLFANAVRLVRQRA